MSSPTTLGSIAQNLLTSIQEVLAAFVTDIQNYAGVIADLLIGVLVGYATVKFGRRIFNAISGWISDLMP